MLGVKWLVPATWSCHRVRPQQHIITCHGVMQRQTRGKPTIGNNHKLLPRMWTPNYRLVVLVSIPVSTGKIATAPICTCAFCNLLLDLRLGQYMPRGNKCVRAGYEEQIGGLSAERGRCIPHPMEPGLGGSAVNVESPLQRHHLECYGACRKCIRCGNTWHYRTHAHANKAMIGVAAPSVLAPPGNPPGRRCLPRGCMMSAHELMVGAARGAAWQISQ